MTRPGRIDPRTGYVFGPDPTSNPRLAQAILLAKRAGFPKPSIEAAINRGQGISPSGAALESVTIEAVLPSSVAAVIECQTDSKARTLQDLRLIIREHGGSVMPTSYLFERKGKVVFEKSEDVGLETVFDQAIEAGATDVDEDEEGRIVVYTEPCQTTEAADALVSSAGLTIQSADIIWDANEDTRVELDSEASEKALDKCVEAIEQDPSVHGVYLNIA
ncbi:MAG: hypothetical protein M1834_000361 [Cirrosporium novae-zelandiae]|nr:MAG: hypothetical protein M1834_000361 [Cirrosporium novae-zelandiae]